MVARTRRHCLPMLALLALAAPLAAHAQYSPDATMDLGAGYGQTALSQSVLQGTRGIDARKDPAGTGNGSASSRDFIARRNAARASIEPEYRMRVARDGKASADAWLARTARALGERDRRAAGVRR